jgi:hypothetical protein
MKEQHFSLNYQVNRFNTPYIWGCVKLNRVKGRNKPV